MTNYVAIALLATALLLAGALDLADQLESEQHYCDMVRQWEDTHGRYGWPAYRGKEVTEGSFGVFLYTALPQRKPLTDEEIDALAMDEDGLPNSHIEFARAIEQAHGIT
jgi:hypothetical protein